MTLSEEIEAKIRKLTQIPQERKQTRLTLSKVRFTCQPAELMVGNKDGGGGCRMKGR